jgi:hypothetical protein
LHTLQLTHARCDSGRPWFHVNKVLVISLSEYNAKLMVLDWPNLGVACQHRARSVNLPIINLGTKHTQAFMQVTMTSRPSPSVTQ